MTIEQKTDDQQAMSALQRQWTVELAFAKRNDKDWTERVKKIVKRYRDERRGRADAGKRYNILWSNVQTLLPAIYSRTPQPDVTRRFEDQDDVGRAASELIERALRFELSERDDFDQSLRGAVLDRLLGGRGVCWVRFEADALQERTEQSENDIDDANDALGNDPKGRADPEAITDNAVAPQSLITERTPVDYVFWEDFRCSPARTWSEVTWVARRVYLSREEVVARFGEQFKDVPLTHVPLGIDEMKNAGQLDGNTDKLKKAQIWEIWDKTQQQVIWIAESYHRALETKPDPYDLDGFFPCPKPLFGTQTTDTIVPVPDYTLYQDQAKELDLITQRIALLIEALKVVGVYDASQTGIRRLLDEGFANTMIPVDSWAAFSERGGVKGSVDWLPLDMVVNALAQSYQVRDKIVEEIYSITGIADIIRGASDPSETATAQRIKGQFGSMRLRPLQRSVSMFATEILRIKAQLMVSLYTPQTLIAMSSMQLTDDAQIAQQAIMMLKTEPIASYRVEIAADSLVELDQEAEQTQRLNFLQAAGAFLEKAVASATQVPALAPLLGEMLLFGIRSFKSGRSLEAAFEKSVQLLEKQPPPPDPNAAQMQQAQQIAQMQVQGQLQIAQAKAQADVQIAQAKSQIEMQTQQQEQQLQAQVDTHRQQVEAQQYELKIQQEAELARLRAQYEDAAHAREMDFQRWKAQLDASTRIEVANISSQKTVIDPATVGAIQTLDSNFSQ
jgi:hypothetical protein